MEEKEFVYIIIEDKFININIIINYFNNIFNYDYSLVFNFYNALYIFNFILVVNFIIIADITIVILLINNIILNWKKIIYFN